MSPRRSSTTVQGSGPGGRITRGDIEAKFREVTAHLEQGAEAAKPKVMPVLAVAAAGMMVVVYLVGRRRGRRRSTVVEIRRV
ncbi:MAG TPA: E3 binding domain-containing protein [Acidimicrobiales bacterium]|nr:E3 binding domain-containing protein [Acidimicrobiales bacterium]